MTLETQTHPDRPVLTPLQFGSAIDRSIDDLNDWPDLRYRDLTAEELAVLRLKIKQMYEVVEEFGGQLEREEATRCDDPAWSERADRPHYVPGSTVSFIHISLKLAQRMLDERRGDEVAVSHLRLAEGLVRQLATWRGALGEGLVEELFGGGESEETATAAPSEGIYTPPRFFIVESVERSA